MEFINLIWSEENYLFSSAIFLMLGIGILEGLLAFIGIGISSTIEHFFPELNVHIEAPITEVHSITEFFGWINKGKVPVLMLFIVFLTVFGLIGLGLQYITQNMFSQYVILIPVILLTIPFVRIGSIGLNKIMPRDETTAVSTTTFIGKICEITNGIASKGIPTEAKVIDDFNYTHYIMVEPKTENELYKKGDRLLILAQNNHIFYVTEQSC